MSLLRAGIRCIFLLTLLAACHRGGGGDAGEAPAPADAPEPESNEPVEVFIRSFNTQPIRVHLVRGATVLRLGVVAEARGQTFVIPRDFYGRGVQLHFVFTPVGGGERFASGTMTLLPGNYVEWTIAEQIKYSTVFVW